MNPEDPESAQRIVTEYVQLLERHTAEDAYPASNRTLPYPKQTIKAAIVTCAHALRHTGQLTDELSEFLETAYIALADYIDEELVRVKIEYRSATAALANVANPRDRSQSPAWRQLTDTSTLAGEIARSVADDTAALRMEFRAHM